MEKGIDIQQNIQGGEESGGEQEQKSMVSRQLLIALLLAALAIVVMGAIYYSNNNKSGEEKEAQGMMAQISNKLENLIGSLKEYPWKTIALGAAIFFVIEHLYYAFSSRGGVFYAVWNRLSTLVAKK